MPQKSEIGIDLTLLGDEHVRRDRETDGEVGYLWNGATSLLLTTKDRKSDQDRTIPIICRSVIDMRLTSAHRAADPDPGSGASLADLG